MVVGVSAGEAEVTAALRLGGGVRMGPWALELRLEYFGPLLEEEKLTLYMGQRKSAPQMM